MVDPKNFALIKWIEDDMYGIMPVTAAKDANEVKCQRLVLFGLKRRGKKVPKYYEALVLKISGAHI